MHLTLNFALPVFLYFPPLVVLFLCLSSYPLTFAFSASSNFVGHLSQTKKEVQVRGVILVSYSLAGLFLSEPDFEFSDCREPVVWAMDGVLLFLFFGENLPWRWKGEF